MSRDRLPQPSSASEVQRFLQQARQSVPATIEPAGRLIFALDATASRQPTWDQASRLQADMFLEAARLGGLALQLVWYRGYREFQVSPWQRNAEALLRQMTEVLCASGTTQIGRVLAHALQESQRHRIQALVFVGDCIEEDAQHLCDLAGRLRVIGLPLFLFQEGDDPIATAVFPKLARLSGGVHCRFSPGSARQLGELLRAAAVYAAGGRPALEAFSRRQGGLVLRLTHQFRQDEN